MHATLYITFFRTVSVTAEPRTMAPVNSEKSAMVTACLWVIVLAATAVEKLFATSLAPGAPTASLSPRRKERAERKWGEGTTRTLHTDAECVGKGPEKSKNGKQWILPCDADIFGRNHVHTAPFVAAAAVPPAKMF